jgi:hypothetical protein
VIAEIIGLDDLGRALIASQRSTEREPELRQVAGEIVAKPAVKPEPTPKAAAAKPEAKGRKG